MSPGPSSPADQFIANLDSWRFVLILLVVLNHALVFAMSFEDMNAIGQAAVIVTRASVPTLSLFSGYLFIIQRPRSYGVMVALKFQSLIMPFLFWNTLIFLVLLGINEWSQIDPDHLLRNQSRYWLINGLTAIHGGPANEPLYFLRDLFLCCALFGLIRPVLRHPVGYVVVLALVALVYVTDLDGRLFIRNAIPLFFVIGMGFGVFPRSVTICRQSLLPLSLMAALLLGSWVMDDVEWSSTSFLGLATLSAFSAVVVGLAAYLPLTPRIATWGRRYAFVIFLCHAWVILGFQHLWGRYEWSEMSYIVAAGLGSIVLGLTLSRVISRLPPMLSSMIVGGRAARARKQDVCACPS